ncbi:hydroxyethylthiazole kinase [Hazenella coriacea]|uniref:Hydroxyethylthiazole kinase n=1 Tax=Hazenella coriacea TaxID=1179467 RepID=A0A4V2UVE2_9BACL|nr:hydroxyethylthiazole kinase [Hazenella coriacea]TCS94837.1 hydroxyethylthiazole kinase [Hazenella coriacea]
MSFEYNWEKIREIQPLIHHITNSVTINDCANMTLACGASPVMADAEEEVEEMVVQSQSLVLNMGTLSKSYIDRMIKAGKAANQQQVPVVLDPVGVGATSFRFQSVERLLAEVKFAVIRGNASEISTLCGSRAGKGVDADTEFETILPDIQKLAKRLNTVIAVSGSVDYVTDGEREVRIYNGTPLLSQVTGTGCMSTSVIGCCLGAGLEALSSAVTAYVAVGLAGEWAERMKGNAGLGTFRMYLMDSVSQMNNQWLAKEGKIDAR